ncbi:MAG: type VI secretion system tip protein VgrG [Phycisphaera sp.]|nr:MAG: type VI secretion system tip protein VgrG [Phycisphaera sp.]
MIYDDADFVTLHEAPDALDGLYVHLVRGSESLGRAFSYTIGLFGTPIAADVTLGEILGRRLTLAIKTSENGVDLDGNPLPKVRYLGGMIRRFWQLDAETHGIEDHVVYELELVPTIGTLETRTNCRIFQDRTTLQIVDLVLADHGIESDRDASRLGDTWPWKQRDYCVQFNETDLAFVQRLLEEEGIAYFFEHTKDGDKLVLASEEAHYTAFNEPYEDRQARIDDDTLDSFAGKYDTLELNRAASLSGESLSSWCRQWNRRPSRYESMDFDGKRTPAASQVIRLQSPDDDSTNGPGTQYEAYAGLAREEGETDTSDTSYLDTMASIRLTELTSKGESWMGKTRSRGVATGYRYEIQTATELGTYLVVRAELLIQRVRSTGTSFQSAEVQPTAMVPEPGTNNTSWIHEATLEAIHATVRYVPDRVTPRPTMHGPHTAFVVDDNGELPPSDQDKTEPASMDNHARVRVRMHWNLDPELDEQDSPVMVGSNNPRSHPWPTCWLRVAQPTASKGWGSWNVPHIGDEVLVSFINGDPDRPVITGRLYNAARMPGAEMPSEPVPDPRNQPRSNHMQVMSDVGGNHLVMNSESGKEQILLHSPQPSGSGSQVWIGGERKINLTYVSDIFGGSGATPKDRGGIGLYSDGDYTVKIKGNDVQQIDGNSFDIVTGIDYGLAIGGSIEATIGLDMSAFVGIQVEYVLGLLSYEQNASLKYSVTAEKGYGFNLKDAGEETRGAHEIFGGEKVVMGGGGTVPPFPTPAKAAMMAIPLAPLIASARSKLTGNTVMPKAYKSAIVLDADGATLRSNLSGADGADYFKTKAASHDGFGRVTVLADGSITIQTDGGTIKISKSKGVEITAADPITLWSSKVIELKAKEIKLTGKVTANGMQIGAPPAPPPPTEAQLANTPTALADDALQAVRGLFNP